MTPHPVLANESDEVDPRALERMFPIDRWLSRVGATYRERDGWVPRERETGPRGRCGSLELNAIAGEVGSPPKHPGSLPTPILTATVEPGRGVDLGKVAIGEVQVKAAARRQRRRGTEQPGVQRARKAHACSACGADGHSKRNANCPKRRGRP